MLFRWYRTDVKTLCSLYQQSNARVLEHSISFPSLFLRHFHRNVDTVQHSMSFRWCLVSVTNGLCCSPSTFVTSLKSYSIILTKDSCTFFLSSYIYLSTFLLRWMKCVCCHLKYVVSCDVHATIKVIEESYFYTYTHRHTHTHIHMCALTSSHQVKE